jgi:hypothetical protein
MDIAQALDLEGAVAGPVSRILEYAMSSESETGV